MEKTSELEAGGASLVMVASMARITLLQRQNHSQHLACN